jgi:hypothetical protein
MGEEIVGDGLAAGTLSGGLALCRRLADDPGVGLG